MPGLSLTATSGRPPLVLVTGANGYIAMWTIDCLLEEGYRVRGVVRSDSKGNRLLELLSKYGERMEYAVVPDITETGAYDQVVKDVNGIIHTAMPLSAKTDDPEEFIAPALHGTTGILQSALRYGTNVQRIVVTGSSAAIIRPLTDEEQSSDEPYTFDETSWGDEWVSMVKGGQPVTERIRYRAAKTVAERAAWNFVKEHESEVKWDLVCLHPTYVLGPSLYGDSAIKSSQDLNVSRSGWFDIIFSKETPLEVLQSPYGYSHVRDAALAHVRALQVEKASGERIILHAGDTSWQETRNLVASLKPELVEKGILPAADTNISVKRQPWNNEKSKVILGISYATQEEVLNDMLDEFERKGFFSAVGNVML